MALQAAAPVAVETPTKSSGNTDQGLMKKLKSFDSLAMSIGNGTAENKEGAAEHRMSERFVRRIFLLRKPFNFLRLNSAII